MLIEIRKAAFVNKGAELMLRTLVQLLRRDLPNARIAMAAGANAPYVSRAKLGLYQKFVLQRYKVPWWRGTALVPVRLREQFGLVLDSEIDLVIDAAGFSYGDQWGDTSTISAAKSMERWKNQRTKVILMPQAFGPFSSKRIRVGIKKMVDNADLVFAREKTSYDHLVDVVGERKNVRIAPDFTNLIEGTAPCDFNSNNNRFCVIPNYRMMDKTDPEVREQYIPFLATCIEELITRNAKPFMLVHGGANDHWLAREIDSRLSQEVSIIEESNALRIKGIIGSCDGVISSRFHGLVSALSQGIPAIGTGWSHKYQELFDDYDFEAGLIDVLSSKEQIRDKIGLVIDSESRHSIIANISSASEKMKSDSADMWRSVLDVISETHS